MYREPYSEKKPVNEANSLAQKEQGKKSEMPVQSEKGDNAILLQLMEKIKLLEEAMKADKSKVKKIQWTLWYVINVRALVIMHETV